jgi:hypothetical protein
VGSDVANWSTTSNWDFKPVNNSYIFKKIVNSTAFNDIYNSILDIQLLDGFDKSKRYGIHSLVYHTGINATGITFYISDLTANPDYSVIVFGYVNNSFNISTDKSYLYELTSTCKIRIKFNIDLLPATINSVGIQAEFSNIVFTKPILSVAETSILLGLNARVIINESDISTLKTGQIVTTEQINALTGYSLGKSYTFLAGTTGSGSRLGVIIPTGNKTTLKIRLTATAQMSGGMWCQKISDGTNLFSSKTLVWVLDGAGGYYYETTVTLSSTSSASNLFIQISNSTTLSTNVTVSFTSISYDETVKDILLSANQSILALQIADQTLGARTTSLETKQSNVDLALKEKDIELTSYADKQSVVIPNGSTSAFRITWTIPIAV